MSIAIPVQINPFTHNSYAQRVCPHTIQIWENLLKEIEHLTHMCRVQWIWVCPGSPLSYSWSLLDGVNYRIPGVRELQSLKIWYVHVVYGTNFRKRTALHCICFTNSDTSSRMKSTPKFGPVIPGVRELKMMCYDDIKRMKR